MKKTLLIILSAVFVFVSCEKNTEKGEVVDTYPLYYSATEYDGDLKSGGTGMSVATISFSELDRVIIDLTTDAMISSVDVFSDATTIGKTVALTGGGGTLDATLAEMDIPDLGDNNYIGLHYEFDGYNANEAVYVKQVSPWSISAPTIIEMDMEDDLEWEVMTANATVDDVTISVSINGAAATDYIAQALDGSMTFSGLDFARDDEIDITTTATSGVKTAVTTTSFKVKKWSFTNTASGIVLADGADEYNLDSLRYEAGYHLALQSSVGSVGFTGSDVDFVVTDKAFYDDNDVNLTMAAYAAGAPVPTVNNANIEDAYIFKTDTDVYGLMLITDKEEYTDPTKSTLTVEIMILEFED